MLSRNKESAAAKARSLLVFSSVIAMMPLVADTALAQTSLSFYPLAPCRLIDTRNSSGPLGGPALAANTNRDFVVAGHCDIPPDAMAISINVTATAQTAPGHLRLYPGGTAPPNVASLNYAAGQTRANNAVVMLGALGDLGVRCVQASGTAHAIIDVNGYFTSPSGPLKCIVTSVAGSGTATTVITFDEPAIAATRTNVYADGSYATCPDYYSDPLSSFTVSGVTFQGGFMFRSNYTWGLCASPYPDIFSGGTLQTDASDLSLTLPAQASRLRLSLVTDGSYHDPAFQLDASAGGEQATATATVIDSVGRFELWCSKPVDSVVVRHAGPWWVLDTLTF